MPRPLAAITVVLLAVVSMAVSCPSPAAEITRDRAVDIARAHATFEIVVLDAARATEDGRPVWRVTMQGPPLSPGSPLRAMVTVYVDRQSGEVISVTKT